MSTWITISYFMNDACGGMFLIRLCIELIKRWTLSNHQAFLFRLIFRLLAKGQPFEWWNRFSIYMYLVSLCLVVFFFLPLSMLLHPWFYPQMDHDLFLFSTISTVKSYALTRNKWWLIWVFSGSYWKKHAEWIKHSKTR